MTDHLGRLEDLPADYLAGPEGAEHAAAVAVAACGAAVRQAEPVDPAGALALPGHPAAAAARRRADADREGRAARAGPVQPGPGAREHEGHRDHLRRPAADPARRDRAQPPPHAVGGAVRRRGRGRVHRGRRREAADGEGRPDPHAARALARARPRRPGAGDLARRAGPAAGLRHRGVVRDRRAPAGGRQADRLGRGALPQWRRGAVPLARRAARSPTRCCVSPGGTCSGRWANWRQ